MSGGVRPPTASTVAASLLFFDGGIHTFSNGTEWECWAESNCLSCAYYDPDAAGSLCAFEYALFVHAVSPALAEMFGWTQNPKYATYRAAHDKCDRAHGWTAPDQCWFFRSRTDDNGDPRPMTPEPDPLQLVLIADPTEVIAGVVAADAPAHAGAA